MNKKPYILLVFLFLVSISAFAQVEADISRPSINAEQFGFALKSETALNKGQLSVSIPLMELPGKGYNLPISLTFYSGDVNACTEASPVGLGWALMAGGVIAVTIKGTDDIDDLMWYGDLNHFTDSDYVKKLVSDVYFLHKLDRIRENSMPDEYTYSLPGHSGRIEFSIDENKTIKRTLFPDESYKIEDTKRGYCITADDGTKFYFEAAERRAVGTVPFESTESTSYFLTSIKTIKGGEFIFHYADEDYFDLSMIRDAKKESDMYHTKRITKIESVGFGCVTFGAASRNDRGDIGRWTIDENHKSMRIDTIELRDKDGYLIKGYELDNSGTFKLIDEKGDDPNNDWYNCRQKLSSITQYDAAGNRLPPYKFTYDYQFSKSRAQYQYWFDGKDSEGYYIPYDSWTDNNGSQPFIDLAWEAPYCKVCNDCPNAWAEGYVEFYSDGDYRTPYDYFCLSRIDYPNGAIDEYDYEPHYYGKINNSDGSNGFYSTNVQGRRIAMKRHYGSEVKQETKYIYARHDSNYNIIEDTSSGVLTNPSIHNATYYTPEWVVDGGFSYWPFLALRASRILSGKPFNSFMGPPVCYTEVEEAETRCYDDGINIYINRTIHYFEPQIVSPPVNYLLYYPSGEAPQLIKIENYIYGKRPGYSHGMEGTSDVNHCYIAYPVGEFCNTASIVDKPLKEVFIGRDGNVRSIKKYGYNSADWSIEKKYGYKIVTPSGGNYSLISKSAYYMRKTRLISTATTNYYYDGEKCDSTQELSIIDYNKGRTNYTDLYYGTNDAKWDARVEYTSYTYPDEIRDITANSASPSIELAAMKKLIEKNMIAEPIKTTVSRNDVVIDGECKDYQIISDSIPLLKSLYKIVKEAKYSGSPSVNGDTIDYKAEIYKEGEILKYDQDMNPLHVRLKNTQDRIYVWGYDGRYPIAVIDNMSFDKFEAITNLKTEILKLQNLKKIETAEEYADLKNKNLAIRNLLPKDAHITTYTYDPYFGMTSETDDSNLGIIYTYDTFGRLTSKYDTDFNKTEEYNYHYKQQ